MGQAGGLSLSCLTDNRGRNILDAAVVTRSDETAETVARHDGARRRGNLSGHNATVAADPPPSSHGARESGGDPPEVNSAEPQAAISPGGLRPVSPAVGRRTRPLQTESLRIDGPAPSRWPRFFHGRTQRGRALDAAAAALP